ncbi:MAG: pilus assembly protein TadG-related protein [Pseudomonadota bacterium]
MIENNILIYKINIIINFYCLRSFIKQERGATFVIVALTIFMLTVFAFMGIDTARAYMAYSRLSYAVDGAALAGARSYGQEDRDKVAEAFLKANFKSENGVTLEDFQMELIEGGTQYEVTAGARISTVAARLVGIETFPLKASATVERELRGLELSMVLDVTGSMGRGSGSKLEQMKSAALILTEIMAEDDGAFPEDFYVSLVPYSASVNIGTHNSNWLRHAIDPSEFGEESWRGCVEARSTDERSPPRLPLDLDEDPPEITDERFVRYLWESTEDLMYKDKGSRVRGDNDWGDTHSWSSYRDPEDYENTATSPNLGCPQPIEPLTNDRAVIDARLGDLNAYFRGGTFTNIGMAWGWRTLSPEWEPYWNVSTLEQEMPVAYDEWEIKKTIILLTDGANGWYDWPDGAPGQPLDQNPEKYDADYTAYGRLSDERLFPDFGGTAKNQATAEIDDRTERVCAAAKQKGIQVYTITFGGGVNSSIQQVMETCASGDGNYFHAPDGDKLEEVFSTISRGLYNLRIVK